MTVFEDTYELWYNALNHDAVETVEGPTSIETLLEACDRFEQLGNARRDGCLVITIDMAREIPRGWIEIERTLVDSYEKFQPFDDMVTVIAGADRTAFICRLDADRLDMEILDPDGVVAIDFDRGDDLEVRTDGGHDDMKAKCPLKSDSENARGGDPDIKTAAASSARVNAVFAGSEVNWFGVSLCALELIVDVRVGICRSNSSAFCGSKMDSYKSGKPCQSFPLFRTQERGNLPADQCTQKESITIGNRGEETDG